MRELSRKVVFIKDADLFLINFIDTANAIYVDLRIVEDSGSGFVLRKDIDSKISIIKTETGNNGHSLLLSYKLCWLNRAVGCVSRHELKMTVREEKIALLFGQEDFVLMGDLTNPQEEETKKNNKYVSTNHY